MPLEDYKFDIDMCVRCSLCKWVNPWDIKSKKYSIICPSISYHRWDAYSAQGRMDISHNLLKKKLDPSTSEMIGDIVLNCTLCGACDVMCKRSQDIEVLDTLIELRTYLVEEEQITNPKHMDFGKSAMNNHNPYQESHEKRMDWLPEGFQYPDKAEIIYFVGCTSSYRDQELARATVKILKAAGVNFGMMHPNEWCCGSPLMRTGQRSQALKLIEHNVEAIKNSGAKKVLTSCAGCYSMLKTEYPQHADFNVEVIHSIELVDDLLSQGKLNLKALGENIAVTYHDPCHLGRLSEPRVLWEGTYDDYHVPDPPVIRRRGTHGIYDPPRNVLKKLQNVEFTEMERIKENAWCCGAGGGVKSAFPEFSMWVSNQRVEEALDALVKSGDVKEKILSTCCPFCKRNLSDAVKESNSPLKVYDIVELIAKSIEE